MGIASEVAAIAPHAHVRAHAMRCEVAVVRVGLASSRVLLRRSTGQFARALTRSCLPALLCLLLDSEPLWSFMVAPWCVQSWEVPRSHEPLHRITYTRWPMQVSCSLFMSVFTMGYHFTIFWSASAS